MAYLYWLNSMVYIEVGDYMEVDTEKIEWLLKNATQYNIAKNTGVAQATISNIVNGKRELKNLTIEVGAKLTDYAKKLQKQEK